MFTLGPRTHGTVSARKLAVVSKAHAHELGRFSTRNNFHREVLRIIIIIIIIIIIYYIFEKLRKSLSNAPFDGTPPENIDEHWSRWKEWFPVHVNKFIPVKFVMDSNSPPWIDGEVRHFIRKKYAALKKFRQSKSVARKHKLRTLTQTIKYLVRRKYREYLAKVKNYFQDNPKLF
jgi:hypothetical protein